MVHYRGWQFHFTSEHLEYWRLIRSQYNESDYLLLHWIWMNIAIYILLEHVWPSTLVLLVNLKAIIELWCTRTLSQWDNLRIAHTQTLETCPLPAVQRLLLAKWRSLHLAIVLQKWILSAWKSSKTCMLPPDVQTGGKDNQNTFKAGVQD